MITPYDTALRLAERKVERVRRAIGEAVLELQRIDAQHIAAEQTLEQESLLAISEPTLTTQHYFLRARDHRERLMIEREETHVRLEVLRRRAVECYGSLSAVEGAFGRYRAAADQAAAAVEQRAIDEVTAARFARDGQDRRRAWRAAAAASAATIGSPP